MWFVCWLLSFLICFHIRLILFWADFQILLKKKQDALNRALQKLKEGYVGYYQFLCKSALFDCFFADLYATIMDDYILSLLTFFYNYYRWLLCSFHHCLERKLLKHLINICDKLIIFPLEKNEFLIFCCFVAFDYLLIQGIRPL